MFLKIHRSPETGSIVAVCDRELINTTIIDGDMEVHITNFFYGDCQTGEEVVGEALSHADNANIIGERAVALAIKMGLVSRAGCIMIGTIPHAQIFRL
jgi:hypothetical protein